MQRSDQKRGSRFVNGGTSTVSGNRLGWWERRIFERSPLDVPFTITKRYTNRPDLLAYDLYGRAGLAWFILQYNNISDINTEFVEGYELTLPTSQRLFGEILARSTR